MKRSLSNIACLITAGMLFSSPALAQSDTKNASIVKSILPTDSIEKPQEEPSVSPLTTPMPPSATTNGTSHPITAETLAACTLNAANLYNVSPAVLIGIMHVEGGYVGEKSTPDKDGRYKMGVMHISSDMLPRLAKIWGVKASKAEDWLQNDSCVNVHVGAWILKKAVVAQHGNLYRGIGASRTIDGKADNSYADKVIKAMDEKGLINHAAPLPFEKNNIKIYANDVSPELKKDLISIFDSKEAKAKLALDKGKLQVVYNLDPWMLTASVAKSVFFEQAAKFFPKAFSSPDVHYACDEAKATLTDVRGNEHVDTVLKLCLTRYNADHTNWANVRPENLPKFADVAFIHPAFYKY